ncbi:MAG: DUF401 family protein [Spirochaetales bacterium]|nr:DUF401 family protein [Spirochaetales bacterium]
MNIYIIISFLIEIPVLIKVLFSLAGILILNRLCKNLIISVLFGTIILAFWSGHSLSAIGSISLQRLISVNLFFLLITIFLVIVFSSQMSETGIIRELVAMVQSMTTKRGSLALLPAIIGLLPMPGGALFSAPLVDDCDTGNKLSPELKTKINYWFRHVWEYWWPIYPGVLLAIEITQLPMWQFILLQLPLSILAVIAGYLFFLRKVQNIPYSPDDKRNVSIIQFLKIIFPVLIIISTIGIRIVFPVVASFNSYIPMCIGIILAIILLQVMRPLDFRTWRKIILSKRTYSLVILVAMVRLYGAFIEAELPGGVLLVETMRMELNTLGIPLIAIVVIIPFIAGLASGLAIGFVGAAFPIVINIIGFEPQIGSYLSAILLAYGAGYMGMMLSPVHVCFIVTNEYFKTRLFKSLVGLIKPVLFVIAGTFGLYVLIRFVLFG